MSILSTMFIATTLAGSLCVGTLPETCGIFQSGNYGNVGYIIGGASTDCTNQLEQILDKLGIFKDDLDSCIKPSLPNKPETETPDNNTPDIEIPDAEVPDNNIPDTEIPDNSGIIIIFIWLFSGIQKFGIITGRCSWVNIL